MFFWGGKVGYPVAGPRGPRSSRQGSPLKTLRQEILKSAGASRHRRGAKEGPAGQWEPDSEELELDISPAGEAHELVAAVGQLASGPSPPACFPQPADSHKSLSKRQAMKRALRLEGAPSLWMEASSKVMESTAEMIPGLGLEDLAVLCLAHVPLSSVPSLRAVCRKWRHLVDSEALFEARHRAGITQAWLCALEWGALGSHEMFAHLWAFDTVAVKWNDLGRLPPMDQVSPGSRMCAIGTSLYLLGGARPPDEFDRFVPVGEVWKYDLLKRKASRCAPMLTARDRFASAIIGGKLYVAGGLGHGWTYAHESLRTAEVYDPDTDSWRALPSMPSNADRMPALECQGGTVNGKFYVRGAWAKGLADIYDPSTNRWSTENNWFPADISSPFYTRLESADHRMYLLDTVAVPTDDKRHKLRVFDEKTQAWSTIAELPPGGFVGAVSVAGVGENVYLAGGEDPLSTPHDAWASRLPFNGRVGKLMSEPCMHVFNMSMRGEGAWQAKNPPKLGVITRWLGTCAVVKL